MKSQFAQACKSVTLMNEYFFFSVTAYKLGGNKKMAVETFDKACEMYKQMRTLFQAARMLEQAVLLSRDLDDMDGVVKYAERGALLYRQDGSNESAAQLLEKACKIVIRVNIIIFFLCYFAIVIGLKYRNSPVLKRTLNGVARKIFSEH